MKKGILFLLIATAFFFACNNSDKSPVEKADSTNEAMRDTSYTGVVPDENSSSFLVRVADGGMAEVEMAAAAQKSANAEVKSFADMLHTAHTDVNNKVKSLAATKNIVLPDSISSEKRKSIDDLKAKTGKDFDRDFVDAMIKKHEDGISMFENAIKEVKDADVNAFAQATLPVLRMHLDQAKAIRKKL